MKKIIALLVTLLPASLLGMQELPKPTAIQLRTNEGAFAALPIELRLIIIDSLRAGDSLEDIGRNLRALTVTNKSLNTLINNSRVTTQLINALVHQFNVTPLDVMLALRTAQATNLFKDQFTHTDGKFKEAIVKKFIEVVGTGNTNQALFLLKHVPNLINTTLAKNDDTALIVASREGRLAMVKLLIQAGSEINHLNKNGETALTVAVSHIHFAIVKELINARANPFLTGHLYFNHDALGTAQITLLNRFSREDNSVQKQELLHIIQFLKNAQRTRKQKSGCTIQ